jgi:hypothetical protein
MTTEQSVTTMLAVLAILMAGCQVPWQQEPPGWHSPVAELFVDLAAFPEGWQIDSADKTVTDSTINHIGRTWGHPGKPETVNQGIWRAYSTAKAKRRYAELLKGFLRLPRTPRPEEVYVEFGPPRAIDFHSQTADEFYLACGWWDLSYCVVFARYRNYVTSMYLEREAELDGRRVGGLTDPEIETVIKAMDARFEQFFASLSTPAP